MYEYIINTVYTYTNIPNWSKLTHDTESVQILLKQDEGNIFGQKVYVVNERDNVLSWSSNAQVHELP